jgi:hypothetical protein
MDEYLLPSFFFLVISFSGAALFLHALISGYKSGVVYVRGGAFYRKRTGLRNASDFWFIMAFHAFIGLLCFFFFGLLLVFLPTSDLGLALTLVGIAINAGISLRRPPEKKALSNTAFSVTSTAGGSILFLAIAFGLAHKSHNFALPLLTLLGSAFLIVIHSIRLKSGKFLLKYRKPRLKPERSGRNA